MPKPVAKLNKTKASRMRKGRSTAASSTLQKTNQKLSKKGYTSPQAPTDDNEMSLDFLFTIGCTVSQKPKDYSMIALQTDTETVENPNIEDQKIANLKNVQISPAKMFPADNDPFYELDDEPPRGVRKYREDLLKKDKAPNTISLAEDIINNASMKQIVF